jgi:hypothetical protein
MMSPKPNTPPQQTMREVMNFIEWSIRHADPEKVRLQKEWEERIEKRFHFPQEDLRPETLDHRP